MRQRHSVRGFLRDPVPRADVVAILETARSAPSGANLQPGKFHALTGAPLAQLCACLTEAAAQNRAPVSQYSYFPDPMPGVLKARQRAAGFGLYQTLGIERRDLAGRRAQFAANYRFFDAPVGVVVTIDPAMGKGCFMDLGLALMALMMAAQARGFATCGIGALANYADLAHAHLALPEDEMVVCGLALGRADPQAAVNTLRTERAPLEAFATLSGFDA
ncbi:nitroreductase [Aquimixticola soesokkakensis]|uniref:nitroreductase n=1 Tax=Aquimixticola soesokkakensis TaxID=1519096 RepID=UPI001F3B09A5|nr:nitroreductase [Aquimixticola soesokkakensis]